MLDGQPSRYSILIGQMNDKLNKGKLGLGLASMLFDFRWSAKGQDEWFTSMVFYFEWLTEWQAEWSLRMVFDLDF